MNTLVLLLLLAQAGQRPAPPQGQNFDVSYRAGLTALNNNDLPQALTHLDTASKIQPKNAQVWLALAQVYFKQNKPKLAEEAAVKAETFGAADPRVLHGLAFFYTESRNPVKAASLEARYAEKTPGDSDAFPRAIDLYLRAEQPKLAIPLTQKAITRGDKPELHALLAKAYEANNEFDKAIPEYRQVLKMRPFDESSYFELSQAYLRRQKFAEALEVLKSAHKNFDKSAQIELATGVALYGLRRFPETIDAFLRTIQLAPDVEQSYVFLGRMIDVAEAKLPDVTGALASFAASKPDNYLSSFLYAKALAFQQADPNQYESLLRKSITLNPSFWESRLELGTALERKRDYPDAAVEFQKSAGLNPKDLTTHYRLARVYDRLGQPEKAAAERAIHAKLTEQEKAASAKGTSPGLRAKPSASKPGVK